MCATALEKCFAGIVRTCTAREQWRTVSVTQPLHLSEPRGNSAITARSTSGRFPCCSAVRESRRSWVLVGAWLDAAAEYVLQHHGPKLADRRFGQRIGRGAQQRGGIDVKGDEVLALGLQVRYLVDEVV